MGMIHAYTFFDRTPSDSIWPLSWKTVLRRNQSPWFSSTKLTRGEYDLENGTLRELLAFSIDPEPSDKQIEYILTTLSVAETMKKCHPQFWTMEEVMKRVLNHPSRMMFEVNLHGPSGLVSVATRAFLDQRITGPTLWAVLKLHNVQANDWLQMDTKRALEIKNLPWHHIWKPIFSWQDEQACLADESTNCLSVTQTVRFNEFVQQAYRENWCALGSNREISTQESGKFRGFHDCVVLAKAMGKNFARLQRPCVYRSLQ
jgi:hypothetical protein